MRCCKGDGGQGRDPLCLHRAARFECDGGGFSFFAGASKDGGPIAQVAWDRPPDRFVLLSNYGKKQSAAYMKWLLSQTEAPVELRPVELSTPMSFGEIYPAARRVVLEFKSDGTRPVFHLSAGTSAMAALWIILAKTLFPEAILIQSSPERGPLSRKET